MHPQLPLRARSTVGGLGLLFLALIKGPIIDPDGRISGAGFFS